jgi:hypothetical protein
VTGCGLMGVGLVSFVEHSIGGDMMAATNTNLVWSIANLRHGPYQPNQYEDVVLPFTILRRLDSTLSPPRTPCGPSTRGSRGPGLATAVIQILRTQANRDDQRNWQD